MTEVLSDNYCIKCGHKLVLIKLDEGEFPCCIPCKIRYTIHGTGAEGSLFVVGAESLKIYF
jgi:hypothetical protein